MAVGGEDVGFGPADAIFAPEILRRFRHAGDEAEAGVERGEQGSVSLDAGGDREERVDHSVEGDVHGGGRHPLGEEVGAGRIRGREVAGGERARQLAVGLLGPG